MNNIIKELYKNLCHPYKKTNVSQFGQIIYINDAMPAKMVCFPTGRDEDDLYSRKLSERRSIFIDQHSGGLVWINSWGYD